MDDAVGSHDVRLFGRDAIHDESVPDIAGQLQSLTLPRRQFGGTDDGGGTDALVHDVVLQQLWKQTRLI